MIFLLIVLIVNCVGALNLNNNHFNKFLSGLKKTHDDKIQVGDYIIKRLVHEEINTGFGYNGGAILPLFDQIENQEEFKIFINRHEQYCGHCAESYAKNTGKIGVFVTTSGPGLTNAITPLQDALSDGIPILCISGQVNSKTLGTDAFQECDATSITKPCVKKSYQIKNTENFIEKFEELLCICNLPRKGPVHLDVCKDIFTEYISLNSEFSYEKYNLEDKINFDELYSYKCDILKNKIIHAEKPILILGNGALQSSDNIRILIEKYHIPTVTTLHGLGIVDELTKFSLGMIGMHGSYTANKAIVEADLIVGIGNRFDDRTVGNLQTYGKNARKNFGIVHIDNSETQIQKVNTILKPELSILADSDNIVEYLVNSNDVSYSNKIKWIDKLTQYKDVYKPKFTKLSSNYIISRLSKILENRNDYKISTGVGAHQMVFAQYFSHRYPNKILSSGSLGTMGVGLPFSIGAQIADPTCLSILIDGDGSFSMSINELATITEYNLPIKIFIMNDQKLGMVDMWQNIFYDKRKIGSNFKFTPKFHEIATTYGIKSYLCNSASSVDDILEKSIKYKGSVLVNFMIEESKSVPFVPNNVSLDKMILY